MSETLCARSRPLSLASMLCVRNDEPRYLSEKREKKKENSTSELVLLTRGIARSKLFLR